MHYGLTLICKSFISTKSNSLLLLLSSTSFSESDYFMYCRWRIFSSKVPTAINR